jgi:FkbM family methyltransferase
MIKHALKELANQALAPFDLVLTRHSHLRQLTECNDQNSKAAADMRFLLSLPDEHASLALRYLAKSRSQLRQDLFVLSELDFKRNGFFVEFGATNGVDLSNTHLLETDFQWEGVLAEPARCWHSSLRENRRCYIDTNCVWGSSGSTLVFNEVEAAELSTISDYSSIDLHHQARLKGKTYSVNTLSLGDLLEKYDAPSHIDYLSIDTEGSEYEILNNLNFDKYEFRVITCEHNYTSARESIFSLLTSHGYVRKLEVISAFDDWYVRA